MLTMETYRFPKRGELRTLVAQAWPERGHRRLVEIVACYAECEIVIDALPSYLALAIESYCEGRGEKLRWACYATMPALIRVLVSDQSARKLVLNEYCAMYDRLCKTEAKYFQAPCFAPG